MSSCLLITTFVLVRCYKYVINQARSTPAFCDDMMLLGDKGTNLYLEEDQSELLLNICNYLEILNCAVCV